MTIATTIYFKLLPWEVIVLASIAVFFLLTLSLLFRALRRGHKTSPSIRKFLLLLCVALIVTPFLALDHFPERIRTGLERNVAETSDTPLFAELRTLYLPWTEDDTYDAAIQAIGNQRGWRLLDSDRQRGELKVEVGVPPLLSVFSDEMVVTISDGAERGTKIDARSQSRNGRGDLGENRRHILQFYHALREQLHQ